MNKRRLSIIVAGKNDDYWRDTVYMWVLEVKEILENEYNIELNVELGEYDSELPIVLVENEIAFVGVPGEEGYLIEYLKKTLDRICK